MPARPPRRNAQLGRFLRLQRLLARPAGASLEALAEAFEVSTRTIRRDLKVLVAHGVAVTTQQPDDGSAPRHRIERRATELWGGVPLMGGALREVVGALRTDPRPGVRRLARDFVDVVGPELGARERARLDALGQVFWDPWRAQPDTAEHALPARLADAAVQHQICVVTYAGLGGPERAHRVLPLRLFIADGRAYLLALQLAREQLITLAVARMNDVEVTLDCALPPRHLSPDAYLASLFRVDGAGVLCTYHLRFDAVVAPYLREQRIHPSQALTWHPAGDVEVTFTCQASVQVAAWVASWREHVEVLAPVVLRDELAALGAHYAARYGAAA